MDDETTFDMEQALESYEVYKERGGELSFNDWLRAENDIADLRI